MSSTINWKQSFWKTVEAQLRSKLEGERGGCATPLPAEDSATWARALILNCLILQDLLPDGSCRRSDVALKQWCLAMASIDILSLAKAFKEFQLFIRTYPDEWAFLDWSDFKHRYPYGFTGDFWSPVRDVLTLYLNDPQPATFRVLNQWVSFPMKLTLKGMSRHLTHQAELDYLSNERRLGTLELHEALCDEIASVLGDWFRGFSYSQDFSPHHSNGAVANRQTRDGLLGKYRNMQSDARISTLYKKFGLDECEFGFRRSSFGGRLTLSHPRAKLITVPKGIDKRRSICPEPAEYQFNQQGIWDLLDEYISRHVELRQHISIHDQSVNRNAALSASFYQDCATIDLSSASDSVSWLLVKSIFRRCPKLLWMMWSTRSTTVRLPSGRVIATNKYAPMGSALCFPVESIIFAAMCQVAVNHAHVRTRDTYHVYGDDIIIPAPAYHEVIRILTDCGFLVNEQKTFDPYCRYKESCGMEGLDGVDVSCLGISRKFSADTMVKDRPKLVACYASLANDLCEKGYMAARTYVLAEILKLPEGYVPPFSGVRGIGILSPNPTNWNAKRRYNESYQCEEILVGCYSSSKDRNPFTTSEEDLQRVYGCDYQEYRYLECLRRLATTKRSGLRWPDDLIQVSLSKSTLRLTSRWLPAWWFESNLGPPAGIAVELASERLEFDVRTSPF